MKILHAQPCSLFVVFISLIWNANAFGMLTNNNEIAQRTPKYGGHLSHRRCAVLFSSNSPYDLSKPVFDLYALRTIRGDALTKYNTVNQSEPLRINLSLLLMGLLLSSPILVPEVTTDPLSTTQTAFNLVGATLTAYLGVWRNCQARNRKLRRWERELAAMDLVILQPNLYDSSAAASASERMGSVLLSGKKVVALYNLKQDDDHMTELQVLRRRLRQAGVVIVSDDTSTKTPSWMARPADDKAYQTFWEEQLDVSAKASRGGWFGLSATGRSFGSGSSAPLSWLQVMGQSLPPLMDFGIDDRDAKNRMDPILREKQEAFYKSLVTAGSEDTMVNAVFSSTPSDQVSDVIEQGGRLDSWAACLLPDALPSGLEIVDGDSFGDRFTTCVEITATGETLLAVQTWNDDGKLLLHQTIPWSNTAPAAGTLLCDCRGCVSLVRRQ